MDYLVHFATPLFLWVGLITLLAALAIRYWLTKTPVYLYPLAGQLIRENFQSRHPYRKIFAILRFFMLALLVLLIGKPQLVDTTSKVIAKGINIMVVLDVSWSMNYQDYADDDRSRFEVAQDEAIHFVQSRPNDAIGLVLFGKDALTRCPLTLDKKMLSSIVQDTKLGIVNPDGTVLSRGVVTAANRLKNSKAKSNIMIVLTDGEPSSDDIDPAIAIEIAKQLGIKIYTVGIGGNADRLVLHHGQKIVLLGKINTELLEKFAKETDGKFFLARNANEMRAIYDTIDKLEKSEYEAPLYTKYYDIFMPFVWGLLALLLMEIILASTVWFSI